MKSRLAAGRIWLSTKAIKASNVPDEIGFQDQVVQCRNGTNGVSCLTQPVTFGHTLKRDGLVSWGWERGQDLSVGYRPADCRGDGISSHDRLDDVRQLVLLRGAP